jgi:hypothetical protein
VAAAIFTTSIKFAYSDAFRPVILNSLSIQHFRAVSITGDI